MRRPALLLALAAGAAASSALLLRRFGGVTTVEVAGRSMSPALEPGDFLLVRRVPPPRGEAAFGLVVSSRDAAGRLLLKRIVGLPGEALSAGGEVHVDGRRLLEPYARGDTLRHRHGAARRLGPDQFFLLGDRRDASTDSRDFGPVDRSRIEGVVWLRYWPPRRMGRLRRPQRRFVPAAGGGGGRE